MAENGGTTSCAQVSGIRIDVVGRRPFEFVHSIQQKLLPVLQSLYHSVTEGGRYWQLYDTQAQLVVDTCSINPA